MKTIGIFYATLTKTTVGIVDEIEFFLKKDDFKTFNVKSKSFFVISFEKENLIAPSIYFLSMSKADKTLLY